MQDTPSNGIETSHNARTWLRILIASYFIAVALRIIPGTDFSALIRLIADPQTANLLTAVTVFSLSYMVMIGCYLRAASLLLGLMTFFAAFIGFVGTTGGADLSAFWRDIALVAALMLTYVNDTERAPEAKPEAPRAANVTELAAIRRPQANTARPQDLRAPLAVDEIETIFQDYAQAR